ncbi:hypothetical protein Tco_0537624 [Tanacetum coccineum]
MAQQTITAEQLIQRVKPIGRCNNYTALLNIPCSQESKIVGQILNIHSLRYALQATADVLAVYLQQFWKTIALVPDIDDTICFQLDNEDIMYTVDMFRAALHLPVETPEHLFIALEDMDTIETFTNHVGYQGVVDKVSAFYIKNLAQPWKTMFKFDSIAARRGEPYHSIKDDVPLVSVYTTGNVRVKGMLIPDDLLTDDIHAIDDFKEYNVVTPALSDSPQGKKRKFNAGETSLLKQSLKIIIKQKPLDLAKSYNDLHIHDDMIEPGSHKDIPENVSDDDNQGELTGRQETRTEKMQTPTPILSRSLRKHLSSDKEISHELMAKDIGSGSMKCVSDKYKHLPNALRRMCNRQGYMIQNMERKCVTTNEFWKVHNKVDQVVHDVVPKIAANATNDLIESNLKPQIVQTLMEECDAFISDVPQLISHVFKACAPAIIEEIFTQQLQNNADNQELWKVLKKKFEKSSVPSTSCRDDFVHSHDQDDDALPEGEKRVKNKKSTHSSKSARKSPSKQTHTKATYVSKAQQQQYVWDAWTEETIIDDDEVIPEDETPELIAEFQEFDKHTPTIFSHARIEATLCDAISNQFKDAEEYAYHLEQSINFMEKHIVWEIRQSEIKRYTLNPPLVFYGPQRNLNEPPRYFYNKDLFFIKNGNTEERKYTLSLHKIHAERFLEEDLEEKITEVVKITTDQSYGLDFMEQIIVVRENGKPNSFSEADFKYLNKNDIEDFYQIKINLTTPKLTFPGIEAYEPYTVVDSPDVGLIYLNSRNEKRFMGLTEIVKFCDATLQMVLKEVDLKLYLSEPWQKSPVLGELNRDIFKAFKRDIPKRLRHREKNEKMGIFYEWKTNSTDDEAPVIINP